MVTILSQSSWLVRTWWVRGLMKQTPCWWRSVREICYFINRCRWTVVNAGHNRTTTDRLISTFVRSSNNWRFSLGFQRKYAAPPSRHINTRVATDFHSRVFKVRNEFSYDAGRSVKCSNVAHHWTASSPFIWQALGPRRLEFVVAMVVLKFSIVPWRHRRRLYGAGVAQYFGPMAYPQ